MACIINENDLNSQELIDALKSIEVEGVKLVENDFLRQENALLRYELKKRHELKIQENQKMGEKRLSIFNKMVTICKNEEERHRMREVMLLTSQSMNHTSDLIFQSTYGLMNSEPIDISLNRIKEIQVLINKGSRDLEAMHLTQNHEQKHVLTPTSILTPTSVVAHDIDIETKLNEIREFDFDMIDPNLYK